MSLQPTTSQTVGPFFSIGFDWLNSAELSGPGVAGERIVMQGTVLDGDGKPVVDAVLEVWQANAQGKYAHPEDKQDKPVEAGFRGFGRVATDDNGRFRFSTVKPGRVPDRSGRLQAPHLAVTVLMRGLLKHLVTRVYFPDEPSNAEDEVLNLIESPRRASLIARKVSGRAGVLEWNVVMQGKEETVFFDC
jgi:protocatechuate 3,4-dioxygenase, alpha subunit